MPVSVFIAVNPLIGEIIVGKRNLILRQILSQLLRKEAIRFRPP